jgi:predicted nucleic-acid-binding Zn-ribbon protein
MEHWQIIANGQVVIDRNAEELWENMCSYFEFCDNNPIEAKRTITSGKGAGNKVKVEMKRPYSVKGMCLHCGISEAYLDDIRQSKSKDDMYYIVVERALYIIHTQLMENALVGEFSPQLTSKVLTLDNPGNEPSGAIRVEIVQGTPELANSENEVLENIKMELEKKKNSKRENGEN